MYCIKVILFLEMYKELLISYRKFVFLWMINSKELSDLIPGSEIGIGTPRKDEVSGSGVLYRKTGCRGELPSWYRLSRQGNRWSCTPSSGGHCHYSRRRRVRWLSPNSLIILAISYTYLNFCMHRLPFHKHTLIN